MNYNRDQKIAYFSMEIGLSSKVPTYSGGLGILAGDTLKAAADMQFPIVGVTLLPTKGYFFQKISDKKQEEKPMAWHVDDFLEHAQANVQVEIANESVNIGCWVYEIIGPDDFVVPILFLTTDLPENSDHAKEYTAELYGDGKDCRIAQEIILGIGGVRMLREMQFNAIQKYHMNEGHSAFITVELQKQGNNLEQVRNKCLFTTHTPVPSGHDKFPTYQVEKYLSTELFDLLPQRTRDTGELNMTELALEHSGFINGVAKQHTEVSKNMFPNFPIQSITNGVHAPTWVSPYFEDLYNKYAPGWQQDPSMLAKAMDIPLFEIQGAHRQAKKKIIDYVNATTNAGFDYDIFTLGWARRFTAYKRPEFLFADKDRLLQLTDKVGPIQIIYGGKAHPSDEEGKKLISEIIQLSAELDGKIKLAYITNYDMYLSKFMTSGVDVWLNTPLPPQEASGTSGMKCALNGIPQASVLDGWWVEGCREGETGWSFANPDELYKLLEHNIMPVFYNEQEKWAEIMQKSIAINGSYFNANRMFKEYIEKAYS